MTRTYSQRTRLLLLSVLLSGASTRATLVITTGDRVLLPNQTGQALDLFVDNPGTELPYGGLNFSIRIGADGSSGPILTGVNLLDGTPLFAEAFGGQFAEASNTPREQFWSVASPTATLPAGRSLLATLTLATTGIESGSWTLNLQALGMPNTQLLDHEGQEHELVIVNGTLSVITPVPEPAEIGVMAGLWLLTLSLWHAATSKLACRSDARSLDAPRSSSAPSGRSVTPLAQGSHSTAIVTPLAPDRRRAGRWRRGR